MPDTLVPRSLTWATSIDVLPPAHTVRRQGDHLVVRSPTNPTHYWGNLLLFDDAPVAGDGERWEALFAAAFADDVRVAHHTFAWDRTDDARGAIETEFATRGYDVDLSVGMIARADEIRPHPRANADVEVRALDPQSGGPDERRWQQVLELQAAGRDPDSSETEEAHGVFSRARQDELRTMFRPTRRRSLVCRHRRRRGGRLHGNRGHRRARHGTRRSTPQSPTAVAASAPGCWSTPLATP